MTRIKLLIIFLSLSVFSLFGQPFPLSDFFETELPKYGHNDLHGITTSDYEFSVDKISTQLFVTKTPRERVTEFALPNGKLKEEDHGEWGGFLKFFPYDTTQNVIEIKTGNIKFIFQCNNKIYFLEGLSHLSMHYGSMYQLDTINGHFSIKKQVDFDYPPTACAVQTDTIIVASGGYIYIFQNNRKEKKPIRGIYPNSMTVFDNGIIYMGIRGGYVKFNLTNNEIKYFIYKKI